MQQECLSYDSVHWEIQENFLMTAQPSKAERPATHEDANLLLRLYELRREEKLRKARLNLRSFSFFHFMRTTCARFCSVTVVATPLALFNARGLL